MTQGFVWTRRLVLAVVVVVLSLAGHAAGSPMLPDAAGVLFAVVLATALTVSVGRGPSPARLFAFLLGAQALLHVVFVLSSDCVPGVTHSMGLIPSTTSVVGHVVASALAVVVLRYGDQVLDGWAALLAAAFGVPRHVLVPIPSPAPAPVSIWDADDHGASGHLVVQARRGPPPA